MLLKNGRRLGGHRRRVPMLHRLGSEELQRAAGDRMALNIERVVDETTVTSGTEKRSQNPPAQRDRRTSAAAYSETSAVRLAVESGLDYS
jgi:hypothetical protein